MMYVEVGVSDKKKRKRKATRRCCFVCLCSLTTARREWPSMGRRSSSDPKIVAVKWQTCDDDVPKTKTKTSLVSLLFLFLVLSFSLVDQNERKKRKNDYYIHMGLDNTNQSHDTCLLVQSSIPTSIHSDLLPPSKYQSCSETNLFLDCCLALINPDCSNNNNNNNNKKLRQTTYDDCHSY